MLLITLALRPSYLQMIHPSTMPEITKKKLQTKQLEI